MYQSSRCSSSHVQNPFSGWCPACAEKEQVRRLEKAVRWRRSVEIAEAS